jgi:hypothetical protein
MQASFLQLSKSSGKKKLERKEIGFCILPTTAKTRELELSELPRKSDSNFFFAGSVLVSGREQRPLLPEPKVSIPKQGPEHPEHHYKDPVLAPYGMFGSLCDRLQFPSRVV